jgi:hypothetical protein
VDGLVEIGECLVLLAQGRVAISAIAERGRIFWIAVNSFGEIYDSARVIADTNIRVTAIEKVSRSRVETDGRVVVRDGFIDLTLSGVRKPPIIESKGVLWVMSDDFVEAGNSDIVLPSVERI